MVKINQRKYLKIFTTVLLLLFIVLNLINAYGDYSRRDYPHWKKINGISVREYILNRDSLIEVKRNDKNKIVYGVWIDPYTGKVFTNPRKLDIDHIYPLKQVYFDGGDNWTKEEKTKIANDPENLLAVSASANRSKGAKDITKWLPTNYNYRCTYLQKMVRIRNKYDLISNNKELRMEIKLKALCDEIKTIGKDN